MRRTMARKRRGSRILKGNCDEVMALGTLANNTVISANFDETVTERTLVLSVELTYGLDGGTQGEGPIIVGIAHSDYSSTEIQEFIQNAGAWSEGDLVNQEIARRKIRIVGQLPRDEEDEVLNDGNPIKTPCKWVLTTGQTLKQFAYNASGGSLTTGSNLKMFGHAWLKVL